MLSLTKAQLNFPDAQLNIQVQYEITFQRKINYDCDWPKTKAIIFNLLALAALAAPWDGLKKNAFQWTKSKPISIVYHVHYSLVYISEIKLFALK